MEKKKQKELWEIEPKIYKNPTHNSFFYKLKLKIDKNEKVIVFRVYTDTSSCGSIQIRDLSTVHYSGEFPDIQTRKKIFDDIVDDYLSDSFNNIFFLDMEGGLLEKFFGDLGFKKVHSYGNLNTGNIVNFWIYDHYTIQQAIDRHNEENEDDDYDEDDDY